MIWGLSPLYFKQVSHVQPTEVLANRVVWSFLLLSVATAIAGYLPVARSIVQDKAILLRLFFSAFLVGANWLTFIWAISNNRIIEASLGYYLNPIISVLLAMVFLGETLSRNQIIALGLATLGVGWQVVVIGHLPAISLLLATSFGLYGLVRKKAALPAIPGLLLETMLMLPFGLAWILWLSWQGQASFSFHDPITSGWLLLAGVITSAPLLLFTGAAPKLRLTTLGFIQYVAPTLSLLLGVFVYGEPFGRDTLICFGFIWAALIIFSIDSVLSLQTTTKTDGK